MPNMPKFLKKMEVRQLEPFKVNDPAYQQSTPPINAFCQDFTHCGVDIGKTVTIMEGNVDSDGNVGYIIVINRMTGERKMITFFDRWPRPSFIEWLGELLTPYKEISLKDKLRSHIRSYWNYRPWLRWIWEYR